MLTSARLILSSLAISLCPVVVAAQAQTAPLSRFATQSQDLYGMLGAMGMYEILAIMGTESTQSAGDIEAQMFPGQGGVAWLERVARLHTHSRMITLFEDAFPDDAMTQSQIAEITDFATSDHGTRIIVGEIAARRAFLDQETVDAAIEAYRAEVEAGAPRLDILSQFNEVNGLVERNVSGALNLRFAFFRGLIDGDAFDGAVPEEVMLAEVWAQEPDVRRMTVEWLYAFQLLAYTDVTDAELEAYVALSDSPAGRAVNSALFGAFDEMLADLSYDFGIAAASFMVSEDI